MHKARKIKEQRKYRLFHIRNYHTNNDQSLHGDACDKKCKAISGETPVGQRKPKKTGAEGSIII
jgi:hypothetical protein